jgi:hypothetical protein
MTLHCTVSRIMSKSVHSSTGNVWWYTTIGGRCIFLLSPGCVLRSHILNVKLWWTHEEDFYSMVWLINLKYNKNQYHTEKHLRNVLRDSITGWEINDNIYIHYPVTADHGLGCLRTPWMCTIQVHPSSKLLVDWICWPGWRGMSALDGARLVSTPRDSTWARACLGLFHIPCSTLSLEPVPGNSGPGQLPGSLSGTIKARLLLGLFNNILSKGSVSLTGERVGVRPN